MAVSSIIASVCCCALWHWSLCVVVISGIVTVCCCALWHWCLCVVVISGIVSVYYCALCHGRLCVRPIGFEPDSYTTIGSNSPDDTAILPDASDARDSALDVVLMSKGEQSVTSSAFSAAARSARSMTDESDCVTVATLSSIGDNPTVRM